MKIPKIVEKLFIGKLLEQRIDLTKLFMANPVRKDALNFANKYMYIEGVERVAEQIKKEFQQYAEAVREIPKQETERESRKFKTWVVTHTIMKINLMLLIVGLLSTVIASLLAPDGSLLQTLLYIVGDVLGPLSLIALCFTLIINLIAKKSYSSYQNKIYARAERLCNLFKEEADGLCKEIDCIYLSSLDPAHREMVLMRREQERMQKEHTRQMEEMRKMMDQKDREIAVTQQQILETQKELLDIERKREDRYSRY